jgi:diacylglycerol kinase (ATP)
MTEREVHILLNPRGAGGRAGRRWARLEAAARGILGGPAVYAGRSAADLTARAAELAGRDCLVVAAGGDGTSHAVVNGLLRGPRPPRAVLGWLPLGSGNDLARAAGVPGDPHAALRVLATGPVRPLDAGRVRWRDPGGGPRVDWFGNSFTLGVSAAVLRLVARWGKPLGGPASYALAAVLTLLRDRPLSLSLATDGGPAEARRCLLLSLTSGPAFGAGMCIAPGARPDDGVLDLVEVGEVSRFEALRVFPRVYRGTHVGHPAVTRRAVRTLAVATPGPAAFDLDGELYTGEPPFEAEVVPGALRAVRGPDPDGR